MQESITAYGSDIDIIRKDGTAGSTRGFIQPARYKNASYYYVTDSTDISAQNKLIYLFIGSADTDFSAGDRLSLNGNVYYVTNREKYIFRNRGLYTRAVLRKYQPPQEDDYDSITDGN